MFYTLQLFNIGGILFSKDLYKLQSTKKTIIFSGKPKLFEMVDFFSFNSYKQLLLIQIIILSQKVEQFYFNTTHKWFLYKCLTI